MRLLNDTFAVVAKQAVLCLINISAVERGAEKLLNLDPPFLITDVLAELIFNPASHIADQCCIILSNLTRSAQFVDEIFEHIQKSKHTLENYVDIFTKVNYSTEGASLHYLASFFANLSQSVQVRKYICRKNDSLMHKLLPFITFKDSVIRRSGTVAAVRNCCFDTENHSWLLSSEVDILPYLLLPLAGNEEYSEEDNEKLPLDLQYLPEDKKRESIADIRYIIYDNFGVYALFPRRCMLLEAVTQLCAKRENREFIREKNTYLILRDLHKEETDPKVLAACENLVDLLIR